MPGGQALTRQNGSHHRAQQIGKQQGPGENGGSVDEARPGTRYQARQALAAAGNRPPDRMDIPPGKRYRQRRSEWNALGRANTNPATPARPAGQQSRPEAAERFGHRPHSNIAVATRRARTRGPSHLANWWRIAKVKLKRSANNTRTGRPSRGTVDERGILRRVPRGARHYFLSAARAHRVLVASREGAHELS